MKITLWVAVTTTHGTVLKGQSASKDRTTDFDIMLPGSFTSTQTQSLCHFPKTHPSFSFQEAANGHSHRAVLTVTMASA